MKSDTELKIQLRSAFIDEAWDHIQKIDSCFVCLEKNISENQNVSGLVNDVFRSFHTMKASTFSLGYHSFSKNIHLIEGVLGTIRDNNSLLNLEIVQILLQLIDVVKVDLSKIIEFDKDIDNETLHKKIDNLVILLGLEKNLFLERLNQGNKKNSLDQDNFAIYKIDYKPNSKVLMTGFDPLILFYELLDYGQLLAVDVDCDLIPDLSMFNPDELYLHWSITYKTKKTMDAIKELCLVLVEDGSISFELVEDHLAKVQEAISVSDSGSGLQPGPTSGAELSGASPKSNTIRVDISKLDILLDLVGELVISESKLKNNVNLLDDKNAKRAITRCCDELKRLIADLQERVMSTRLVPIEMLFSQFHRVVRDLAFSQKKSIRFELNGRDTEIDKNIMEKISSPLKHIVRNAIDHGIEYPDERNAMGKAAEAQLLLGAYHKEGALYIEIQDDGRGIDTEKVRSKALEKKLISEHENLNESQLINLIFLPGFSTAAEVTDISGRGVGMDVVRKSIEELNGSINIETHKNKGTKILLKLPLTMAIIDGLLFRIGDKKFAVPLVAVNTTYRPKKDEIKTIEGKGEYVTYKNQAISLVRLHRLFKLKECVAEPDKALLLNIQVLGKEYAFMVDDVIGQQQVVMKSLEKNYGRVRGFAGATILGDGSVASIVDPEELIDFVA